MKGVAVKEFLRKRGWKVAQVADIMGESKQNLSGMLAKDDVKTGLVERISVATGIPVVEFYGGEPSQTAIASGENSIAAVNSKVGKDALEEKVRLLEKLLEEKERTIQILMGR